MSYGGKEALPADVAGFGRLLRRLRIERGWTLQNLAEASHYSVPHLSNIENGRRVPTRELAVACERVLDVDGVLRDLVPAVAVPLPDVPVSGDAVLVSYTTVLDGFRALGRVGSPRLVFEPVAASAKALSGTALAVRGPQQRAVWLLAARFAEFAGWMAQESGNIHAFLRWTQTASEWAGRGGQPAMNGYLWVRRALAAEHGGDAHAAIGSARRAADHELATVRIKALAARREAAAHAITGDRSGCLSALDRAAEHLSVDLAKEVPDHVWGPKTSMSALAGIRAGCLVTLRRYDEALTIFDSAAIGDLTDHGSAGVRFAVRRAQALAGLDEPAAAASEIGPVLPDLARLDSASARRELAVLVRLLQRCSQSAETSELINYLSSAGRPT